MCFNGCYKTNIVQSRLIGATRSTYLCGHFNRSGGWGGAKCPTVMKRESLVDNNQTLLGLLSNSKYFLTNDRASEWNRSRSDTTEC